MFAVLPLLFKCLEAQLCNDKFNCSTCVALQGICFWCLSELKCQQKSRTCACVCVFVGATTLHLDDANLCADASPDCMCTRDQITACTSLCTKQSLGYVNCTCANNGDIAETCTMEPMSSAAKILGLALPVFVGVIVGAGCLLIIFCALCLFCLLRSNKKDPAFEYKDDAQAARLRALSNPQRHMAFVTPSYDHQSYSLQPQNMLASSRSFTEFPSEQPSAFHNATDQI
jgi:hypothetical protein